MPISRLLAGRHLPQQLISAHARHTYATIASDRWPSSSSSDNSNNGKLNFQFPSLASKPTPYQILSLNPTEPYTKHRFIELVKLYHPDYKHRHTHSSHAQLSPRTQHQQLPEHVRLERYRLIVAAHALLSDPVKRAAYDVHGIGWLDGLEDSVFQRATGSGGGSTSHRAARAARGNATWEDWERWRGAYEQAEHDAAAAAAAAGSGAAGSNTSSNQNSNAQQQHPFYQYYSYDYHHAGANAREPVYMRNSRFASLLLVLSVAAGIAQTMHAENLTEAKRLVREERHWRATQDYRKSQEIARKMGREQRIEEFVKQRDPAVLTNATLREVVMNPDLCESGNEIGRYRELDMKRMFVNKSRDE